MEDTRTHPVESRRASEFRPQRQRRSTIAAIAAYFKQESDEAGLRVGPTRAVQLHSQDDISHEAWPGTSSTPAHHQTRALKRSTRAAQSRTARSSRSEVERRWPARDAGGPPRPRRLPPRCRGAGSSADGRSDAARCGVSTVNGIREPADRIQKRRTSRLRQASPSAWYSRKKPSNRRRWPSSSRRIEIAMSFVTGSMPSVASMIRL